MKKKPLIFMGKLAVSFRQGRPHGNLLASFQGRIRSRPLESPEMGSRFYYVLLIFGPPGKERLDFEIDEHSHRDLKGFKVQVQSTIQPSV